MNYQEIHVVIKFEGGRVDIVGGGVFGKGVRGVRGHWGVWRVETWEQISHSLCFLVHWRWFHCFCFLWITEWVIIQCVRLITEWRRKCRLCRSLAFHSLLCKCYSFFFAACTWQSARKGFATRTHVMDVTTL